MSTWGTRRVFDALQRLSNVYYRRKYGALAQQMGRTDCRSDTGQGLIIIQIDGLSYDQFQRAITLGTMPHLTRLIAQGRLKVSSWQCGLPSTTPAVQAGIMFGCRDDIPGFRWYEKATRSAIVAKRPDQMRAVQARVRGARPGLLAGGSSYVNMFDGDADLAVFTLSAFPPGRLFEAVRGVGLFSLFLLSPFRLVRIVALTVVRYFESLLWRATALFRPMVLKPYDVISPLLGATVNTLFTEVQTFGVALDIYRQVPIIYTNYNHYDEVAHHLGPAHRSALRVLRDVDRRIGQIDRMRTLYSGRAYDLFVLSDHGNAPSIPLSWLTGKPLGAFIAEQLGEQVSLGEEPDGEGVSQAKARYLLAEMEAVSAQLPGGLRRASDALWRYVAQRVPADPEVAAYDLSKLEDVVVRVSGPLAHVYFNVVTRPLDLIEVMLLYPNLLDRLFETGAVGLVAGRSGDKTVVMGPTGGMGVIGDGFVEMERQNPLAPFGDPAWVAGELHRVVGFSNAGDLLLLGKVFADGRVVTFEKQVSTHGGLGGAQGRPFIVYPPGSGPFETCSPEDLHRIFYEWHRHDGTVVGTGAGIAGMTA